MKRKMIDILIIITVVILIISLSASTIGFATVYKVKNTYREISKEVTEITDNKEKDKGKKINFEKLKKINPDVVGWINIPNTTIDYPIVASFDNEYYLNHNFKREYSQYGAIFTDYRLSENPFSHKNCIVYGHNMGRYSDVMFSSLMKYENKNYYDKHKYVFIDTEEGHFKYKIISIKEVDETSDVYDINFFEKEPFKKWLSRCVKGSMIKCDEVRNLSEIENAITLSTCTYSANKLVLTCVPEIEE